MPRRFTRRGLLRQVGASLSICALGGSVSVLADLARQAPAVRAATLTQALAGSAEQSAGLAAAEPDAAPLNVWAGIREGIPASLADLPPRVYVPHERGGDIAVIDPLTMQVVDRFSVGRTPHHVTPSYGLDRLYVNVMDANRLVVIDPREGRPVGAVNAAVPYNLYFSPDGTKAIVAAEYYNRLDFYDPASWQPLARVPIPGSGVDHLDFSADGSYLLVSCEFGGQVVKVDVHQMAVAGVARVGGLPVDVKVSPDGSLFYVANQGRHGVSVVDPVSMRELEFLPTGRGAHGLCVSRDTQVLFVSNRLAGTISVIDFAAAGVAASWWIGGSPDMLQVSPDGQQLWASGRNHGSVYVVNTKTGQLEQSIRTGAAPHGLTYFPQPGRYCIGHNGVYR